MDEVDGWKGGIGSSGRTRQCFCGSPGWARRQRAPGATLVVEGSPRPLRQRLQEGLAIESVGSA
jgi:hypothetical protein